MLIRNLTVFLLITVNAFTSHALGGQTMQEPVFNVGDRIAPGTAIDVPEQAWAELAEAGTIAFRFRPSAQVRVHRSRALSLVDAPLMQLTLLEQPRLSNLRFDIPERSDGMGAISNHLALSRLDPQWYHLALTWDAETGRVELYLNGILQSDLHFEPWEPRVSPKGPLRLGGRFDEGEPQVEIVTADVALHAEFLDPQAARRLAEEAGLTGLTGEGRTLHDQPLDLSGLDLRLVYESDFDEPLKLLHEDDLFENGERVRHPGENVDWVFEGSGEARTDDGQLVIENHDANVVLWNNRAFPADFLLEFTFTPQDPDEGLAIVFFATRPVEGETIFDSHLPRRAGEFVRYTREGTLNGYHVSYMATWPPQAPGGTQPRRTTNLRKNDNFYMVAVGDDRVTGNRQTPNTVRLLKHGNHIRVEVNGRIAVAFDDDEDFYGLPIWGDGYIGLRQMQHTFSGRYDHFRVYEIE